MFRRLFIAFFFAVSSGLLFGQSGRKGITISFKQLTEVEDYSRLPEEHLIPIADTLLLYQFPNGGWPKDQTWEMTPLSPEETQRRAKLRQAIKNNDLGTTIEDGATTLEIFYLAKVYQKTADVRYREALIRGVEYLLSMQYENGGWPLVWPSQTSGFDMEPSYQDYITFNNDAMVNVMRLLKDVADNKSPYMFAQIDEGLKARCTASFYKGVLCILDCQVRSGNDLTVWAQQYDQKTMQPMKARDFEIPALTGCGETVGILSLLMDIPEPSERVLESVTSAVHWLEKHAIRHKKMLYYVNRNGLRDVKVTNSRDTTLVWNRFYDIETGRPFFSDYDGIKRDDINDISYRLRNSYVWMSSSPDAIIKRYYGWIRNMRMKLKKMQQQQY